MREKDFSSIETKHNICINMFYYKNKLIFPIYISDQKFENQMDLLLVTDGDKLHRSYIKDFDRFLFHKTKNKNKNFFCKSCLQGFSSKNVSIKHKENCLNINGEQSVRLEKGTTEFKNYFKQIPGPFKIYADLECNLKNTESSEGFYSKKYQDQVLCSFAYKLICVDDEFTKPKLFLEVKTLLLNFLKQFLKSISIVKK